MKKNQDPNWIKDIPLHIVVELGKTEKSVGEISAWRKGTTIKLEDSMVNILKVYVNDKYFAYGDVLRNQDGEMSLRIKKVLVSEKEIRNV